MRIWMPALTLAMALWTSGAMAATATCTDMVQGAQTAERIALDGAWQMTQQKVPISATDRSYQLNKVTDAAIAGKAALAACRAPGDADATAPVRKWQPGREAEVTASLADPENCRTVLFVVQTVLDAAPQKAGADPRKDFLVDAALLANDQARTPCSAFADNIAQFAQTGAARRAAK